MFETFDSATDGPSASRFALSTTASLAVLGLIGLAAVTAASTVKHVLQEKKVDVVFRPPPPPAPVAKVKPPPPPPPPKPAPKAAPKPPPAAPVVAAPAPLVAPKEVPLEKPPEADAANAVAAAPIAVGGTGALVAGAVVGGIGTGEGTGGMATGRAAPINLPENATPPEALEVNAIPEYPSEARSKGLEGLVILKGVVEVDGRVTNLKVMKGEEPFVTAAMQAVRAWRFKPARVEGQPAAVYRIFKVPFRLKS